MAHPHRPAPPLSPLLRAAALLATVACALAVVPPGAGAKCDNETDIVLGLTRDQTLITQAALEGFRAAIAEASLLTKLRLRIVPLNSSESEVVASTRALIEEQCAFMVVGNPGTSATEEQILELLKNHSVPLVGPRYGGEELHSPSKHVAVFPRRGAEKVRLPVVVNIRASAGDEMNAILSMLCSDWEAIPYVSLVAQDTPLGSHALGVLNASLAALSNSSGLSSHYLFPSLNPTEGELDEAEARLFSGRGSDPKSIVVCTVEQVASRFIERLAHSRHTDLRVFLLSWTSALGLSRALGSETKALLEQKRILLFFAQSMPYPTPPPDRLALSSPLIQKFNAAGTAIKSHAALEGYLTGWFIYEAAQQAAVRYGLPLTRGDFMYTIFEDLRTFNVLGMTLGPYGDGGISGDPASTQNADDMCNQGVHEVYLTKFSRNSSVGVVPVPGGSIRFAGCNAPVWQKKSSITVVGLAIAYQSDEDLRTQSGVIASVQDFSPDGLDTVVVRSAVGNLSHAADVLRRSSAIAAVCPKLPDSTSINQLEGLAAISPMPGFWDLRRPFVRSVVNLFPSSYDEMAAAFAFFTKRIKAANVAVLMNDDSSYTVECFKRGKEYLYTKKAANMSMDAQWPNSKATPKEDQRLIKEEVLLLHKHHHPNLLMLMGYCETHTEIFVVTEFMECGTLADYLTDIVVGLAVGPSLMELSAAEGFRAAITEAQRITLLPLRLVERAYTEEEGPLGAVERLLEAGAFMVVGRPGNTAAESHVLALLKKHKVPLVGMMSGSESLRKMENNTARFRRSSGGDGNDTVGGEVELPLVVTMRGSVDDEINGILSVLSQDWEMLSQVSMVAETTPLGVRALQYTNRALSLFNSKGLLSNYSFEPTDIAQADQRLFGSRERQQTNLIMCMSPETTVQFIKWLASSNRSSVFVFLTSWSSALDVRMALDNHTRAQMASKSITLHFTQTMPFPTPKRGQLARMSLIRKFNSANVTARSHSALEGYLTGWFIYEVAQKAAARNGLPLTRASFLYTIFVDVRTFNVQGMTLGPYGDGGISGALSGQSREEACNQGVHEVYMIAIDPATGDEVPLPGASLKFAWCTTPKWFNRSSMTFVGAVLAPGNDGDVVAHSGFLGAVQSFNSQSATSVVVRSATANITRAAELLSESRTVVVVSPTRVEFFNIRKGELELGKCMGHGRVGSIYLADWHGTTVAVRVIDKKATPKEDQRLIKEEVLLLHKHHHPNLLMLMGFCETNTELLVVTEFMEGGTLADYLARGKPFIQIYSLISMAFDVLKGIAYLHSCKPPIVHGSISTHNLLSLGKFEIPQDLADPVGEGEKLPALQEQKPSTALGNNDNGGYADNMDDVETTMASFMPVSNEDLRNVSRHVAMFTRNGREVTLPVVVNIRASTADEMNIVLSMMCSDWESIAFVSLVAQDSPVGRWALSYLNKSISFLNRSAALLSYYLFRSMTEPEGELAQAESAVFASTRARPQVLIVCTAPNATKYFVRRLAQKQQNIRVFLLSWTSAADLSRGTSPDLKELLLRNNIRLFFTQSMPFPSPPAERLARSSSLIQKFSAANTSLKSHSALEGYLTGWFIYEAAQEAATRNGLPITRGDFLHTIFVDARTFNVLGVTLGPYGVGTVGGASAMQSKLDECNQGIHEVYITRFDPSSGLQPVPGRSIKFPGCSSPRWYMRHAVTVVGLAIEPGSREDLLTQKGVVASIQDFSTDGTDTVVDFALFSPMPGYWRLRHPFNRSFFVGKFLEQVISLAKQSHRDRNLTADDLIDAVYHRGGFMIDNVRVVPKDLDIESPSCAAGVLSCHSSDSFNSGAKQSVADQIDAVSMLSFVP
eukprot:m51a1_g8821 putative pas domain-containing protein tyrosine kinase (1841) ;mRNA; f:336092-350608